MPVITKTANLKLKKIKTAQRFVRVNIDSKLDKILNQYNQEYPLFTNSDIIKMLISQGIRKNQTQSFKQILSGQQFLDIQDHEAQFQWLKDNGLDRKSK